MTRSVIQAAHHLTERGHQVTVVAPDADNTDDQSWDGPTVVRVPSVSCPHYPSIRVGVASPRTARRLVADFNPDVVHLAAPTVLGPRIGAAARAAGIPSVALFQTDLAGFASNYRGIRWAQDPIWRRCRTVHNRSDLTLAPTATVAADLRRRGFASVQVWGRGVDHHQFNPARRDADLRRAWGSEGKTIVGFVGRLAAEKQIERLLVVADDPAIQLVIVGDGPERAHLEQRFPGAHFTGLLHGNALGGAMASLDLFVHTGDHETFCQTIQEAMAAGVPVLAPAAGGPIDLVDHGGNGLLYQPGDDDGLARDIRRLAADPELRRRLSLAGAASVAGRTWEAVGDQLIEHYRSVLPRADIGPGHQRHLGVGGRRASRSRTFSSRPAA